MKKIPQSGFKAELKQLVALAVPVFFAELSTAATAFVDTVMAGQAGTQDLAGVAISSSLWAGIAVFVMGLFMAVNPVVAQFAGAQRFRRIQRFVQQSLWVAALVTLLILLLFSQQKTILAYFIDDPVVFEIASGYLFGLSWGIPAFVLYAVLRPYSEGISFTRPHMVSALVGLLVNIPANYILIFGKFGFPQLGGAGCGWATSLSLWAMLLVMVFYTRRSPEYKLANIYHYRFSLHTGDIKSLLNIGVPIGFTILVEASIFAFITLFLGGLPANHIAGHQVAMNVAFMLFMFPFSISIAASIRVGFNVGAGDLAAARLAGFTSMILAVMISMLTATLLFTLPDVVASIYTDDPEVIAQAVSLLFFAALFQFSDALVTPVQGILRGYHDTHVALMLNLLAYWVLALPLGYILGLTDLILPAMGAKGFWISLVTGLTIACVLLIPRFLYISQPKRKRV